MCFKFTQQPDPPFPVLKRIHFPPTCPWVASLTEQSLLQGCIHLIMFISTEPPLHLYQVSVTQFINHLKGVSSQSLCISYTWAGDLVLASIRVCFLPRSIGTPSPCNKASRDPERDKGAIKRPEFICAFHQAMIISHSIFSWDGWDPFYFKWLQKDNAVIAYLRKLPAVQRKRSDILKCDSET